MAPKSMTAWLYIPGEMRGTKDCANDLNTSLPSLLSMGLSMPKYRDNTRYTLPSTTAVGMP